MCTPRASASTSSGCAYSRSIRSRTRRNHAKSRSRCSSSALAVTPRTYRRLVDSEGRAGGVRLEDLGGGAGGVFDDVDPVGASRPVYLALLVSGRAQPPVRWFAAPRMTGPWADMVPGGCDS